MIELIDASAWLGNRQVLKQLNWQLTSGENWLITGDNGAGKSTLLRMLHAEIRPARGGRIAWPGLGNPRDVWELRRRIALVSAEFQARYRYPTRVFDAVASGFHSSVGLVSELSSEQRERVEALLAEFELAAFRDRLLSTLSYGQRHRALIARTLATEPKILLLDEPWEGLDSESGGIVAEQIGRWISAGTQVVCVSHVGPRGLSLNRRMRLVDGRIAHAGDSVEPRENSASARSPAPDSRRR
jgi:molybdate transport system ATP-binding protein